jgi:hypothetical protein
LTRAAEPGVYPCASAQRDALAAYVLRRLCEAWTRASPQAAGSSDKEKPKRGPGANSTWPALVLLGC